MNVSRKDLFYLQKTFLIETCRKKVPISVMHSTEGYIIVFDVAQWSILSESEVGAYLFALGQLRKYTLTFDSLSIKKSFKLHGQK